MKRKPLFVFLLFFLPLFLNAETAYKSLGFKGINNPAVQNLREYYLNKGHDWLYSVLDEAEEYRIYVRKELAKRKMPLVLEYLPVVESNYIPTAKSRSGATGMWQFMTNSVKPFLEYDEWVDERLDPWKSTDAALKKLQDNYKTFGDWLLAITAYNCGAGALKRTIKKAGSSDFWYLSENGFLSEQAQGYVPKLLAIADVTENASYYGKELPQARDKDGKTLKTGSGNFDYISVKQSVSIKALAASLRIDENELTRLNLKFIKGVTPAGKTSRIRLPEGMEKSAEYELSLMGISSSKAE